MEASIYLFDYNQNTKEIFTQRAARETNREIAESLWLKNMVEHMKSAK